MNCLLPIVLGLLAGGSVFAVFAALAGPRRRTVRAQRETLLPAIQVRIDKARLGVSAAEYIARSLAYGVVFGLLMSLATGSWLVFLAGLVAGFPFAWAQLEDRRNERLNDYHKSLASAADAIVNSWTARPSINRALETVATYGRDEVAADFEQVLADVRSGTSLREGLQRVADRRESPVFDALATALLLAAESSGEVRDMLSRQAQATRAAVVIYEETIDSQRAQRKDNMWGIVGPWAVLALVRVFTVFTGGTGYGSEFFTTFAGQIVAVAAAVLTVIAYVHSHRTAGRGLIIDRVELERGAGDEPADEGTTDYADYADRGRVTPGGIQ